MFPTANGLIVQWGVWTTTSLTTTTKAITLPIAFSNAKYTVVLGHYAKTDWSNGANANYTAQTATTLTVYECDGYGFGWLAIGI